MQLVGFVPVSALVCCWLSFTSNTTRQSSRRYTDEALTETEPGKNWRIKAGCKCSPARTTSKLQWYMSIFPYILCSCISPPLLPLHRPTVRTFPLTTTMNCPALLSSAWLCWQLKSSINSRPPEYGHMIGQLYIVKSKMQKHARYYGDTGDGSRPITTIFGNI